MIQRLQINQLMYLSVVPDPVVCELEVVSILHPLHKLQILRIFCSKFCGFRNFQFCNKNVGNGNRVLQICPVVILAEKCLGKCWVKLNLCIKSKINKHITVFNLTHLIVAIFP